MAKRDSRGRFIGTGKKGQTQPTGQPKRVAEDLGRKIERVVGQVIMRSLQALHSASPVDTGHARSGWTPATGSPITDRLDRPKDEEVARANAAKRRTTNAARTLALARTYRLGFGPAYLSNNVPYVPVLNSAATPSAQADPGWIERSIELAVVSLGGTAL